MANPRYDGGSERNDRSPPRAPVASAREETDAGPAGAAGRWPPIEDATPREPLVMPSRTANGVAQVADAHIRPRRRSGPPESWLRRFAMYPVLLVMAGADAYGFWNTLTRIIKQDTDLILVFVSALALGSVAAAHELGRLARSRWDGYGGSVGWMAAITTLWIGLGAVIGWLRAQDSLTEETQATGELAGTPLPASNSGSLQMAILLLALYLLTGVLAATHAYRFSDPRTAEIRRVERRLRKLAATSAAHRYRVTLAEGMRNVRQDDERREQKLRQYEHDVNRARRRVLQTEVRLEAARQEQDPAATDELIPPPDRPDPGPEYR